MISCDLSNNPISCLQVSQPLNFHTVIEGECQVVTPKTAILTMSNWVLWWRSDLSKTIHRPVTFVLCLLQSVPLPLPTHSCRCDKPVSQYGFFSKTCSDSPLLFSHNKFFPHILTIFSPKALLAMDTGCSSGESANPSSVPHPAKPISLFSPSSPKRTFRSPSEKSLPPLPSPLNLQDGERSRSRSRSRVLVGGQEAYTCRPTRRFRFPICYD